MAAPRQPSASRPTRLVTLREEAASLSRRDVKEGGRSLSRRDVALETRTAAKRKTERS